MHNLYTTEITQDTERQENKGHTETTNNQMHTPPETETPLEDEDTVIYADGTSLQLHEEQHHQTIARLKN